MSTNTSEVELRVNGQQAIDTLEQLKQKALNISEAMAKAYNAGDVKAGRKLAKELKSVNAEIKVVQKSATNLENVLHNLSGASVNDLQKAVRMLNKELSSGSIERGSAKWKQYTEQLQKVKAELNKINAEQKLVQQKGFSFTSLFSGFADVWAGLDVVNSVKESVNGLISDMRSIRNERDDSFRTLQAISGLDEKTVKVLEEDAKRMATSTIDGGLRVTQSASDILLAFQKVIAANSKLAHDHDGLLKSTTEAFRMASASGENFDTMVQSLMISMNEYGASAEEATRFSNVMAAGSKYGAAAIGDIANSVRRAGVAANSANVPIEELTGAIETLAGKGIYKEVAGTGLKRFFLTLATGADETNPKIVGLSKSLEVLANQHLTDTQLKKQFGLAGYNVAKVLIENRDQFEFFTQAVTGTEVAIEQAAIMSDSYSAKSAQLKNSLDDVYIEIMGKLNPVLVTFYANSNKFTKLIPKLMDLFIEWGPTILALIAPLAAYNVAIAVSNSAIVLKTRSMIAYIASIKLSVVWEKTAIASKYLFATATALLTGNLTRARIAFNLFSKALSLSPIGIAVSAITALGLAVYKLATRNKEASDSVEKLSVAERVQQNLNKRVSDSTSEQIGKVKMLASIMKSENAGYDAKISAINQLKEIIPGYNAMISDTGELIENNTLAIEDYIAQLTAKAKADSVIEELNGLAKKEMPLTARQMELEKGMAFIEQTGMNEVVAGLPASAAEENMRMVAKYSKFKQELADVVEQLNDLAEERQHLIDMITNDGDLNSMLNKNTEEFDETDYDDEKLKDKLKRIELEYEKEKLLQIQMYNEGKINYKEYTDNLFNLDQTYHRKRRDLYESTSKEWYDHELKYQEGVKKSVEERIKLDEKELSLDLKKSKLKVAMDNAEGLLDEKAYKQAVFQLEVDFIQKKRQLYRADSQEYFDLTQELEEKLTQDKIDKAKEYNERLKDIHKKYNEGYILAEFKKELDKIDELVLKGGIDFSEADRAKKAVQSEKSSTILNLVKGDGGEIETYRQRLLAIKQMEEEGVISHEMAEKRKLEATNAMLSEMSSIYSNVYDVINNIVSSASDLISANAEYETAKIESEYDRRIEKAGNNTRKVEKLEKEKEAKVAQIKTEANDRAMKIELAQALAQVPMSAINAYSSAAAVPYVGWMLAPVAAASAIAAGMLQVATIKKRHQTEQMGYASGGFTPLGAWDEPQGIVHSEEFVANRKAVRNKNILPALRLIDNAQRNNTISRLTADDVTASLYSRTSPDVVSAVSRQSSVSSSDSTIVNDVTARAVETTAMAVNRLTDRLDNGIYAYTTIAGEDGIEKKTSRYNRLKDNVK